MIANPLSAWEQLKARYERYLFSSISDIAGSASEMLKQACLRTIGSFYFDKNLFPIAGE
jgi:hypothetical protein